MQDRVVYRYSECFKREVVAALAAGRFGSVSAAEAHFGIKGVGAGVFAYGGAG